VPSLNGLRALHVAHASLGQDAKPAGNFLVAFLDLAEVAAVLEADGEHRRFDDDAGRLDDSALTPAAFTKLAKSLSKDAKAAPAAAAAKAPAAKKK
jgi:hypothetical protein